ncbi:hypothetical protein KC332_g1068 [Hortaea werneckii]|uniref:Uncharacterized protein n=1 Tax=Hortaea werneckii EXF-2000 TaxID=1157616 RepID=A0A1Z5T955_HORWE|nr:hypothetical protein KC358_g997 [Hortaea werneckii]OTA32518.1 hypothetical protein BTJ68_08309 [Hortaea werneckii EXF-2000]KAI6852319.1 hypothetical protein KC350_g1001 [Hortaea werneckii]KAI6996121.1 hypothetical protein KC329_g2137 [Hortaea werneckii]KAI7041838.1 hypothetical protein KC362_g4603 [Hortaea werneckii]
MGGSDMPYLYTPTTHRHSYATDHNYPHSDFNPKAVTQASYARLSQQSTNTSPPKKREGPLINFNEHPDSYVVYSGDRPEFKPVHKGAKRWIVGVRWFQFGLRIVTEIMALGLLVCAVCLTDVDGAAKYLIRIPQAWDALIGIYAIYHLGRPAKSRLPGSAASYSIFAAIMDICLIPLYVYIVYATNANRQLPVEQKTASGNVLPGDWRWNSYFDNEVKETTDLLLLVTFCGAVALAGLHLVALGPDIYLAIMFKKISGLPPDMNPLEDNLTGSKRTRGHKAKNSEWTLNGNSSTLNADGDRPDMSEDQAARKKALAHLSGSTLDVGPYSQHHPNATMESLLPPYPHHENGMPFGHSRNGSKTSLAYSPHNPESARWSRHQYDGHQSFYQDAIENKRKSRYEVLPNGQLAVRARGAASRSPSPTKKPWVETPTTPTGKENRNSFLDKFEIPENIASSPEINGEKRDEPSSPRPESFRTCSPGRVGSPGNSAPNFSLVQREQKERLLDDNWYVLDQADDDNNGRQAEDDHYAGDLAARPPSRQRTPALFYSGTFDHNPSHGRRDGYSPVIGGDGNLERHDSFEPVDVVGQAEVEATMRPKPLGMHPPTPPMPDPEDNPYAPASHQSHPSSRALYATNPDAPEPAEDPPTDTQPDVERSLTAKSAATQSSSIYSESAPALQTHPSFRHPTQLSPNTQHLGTFSSPAHYAREMDSHGVPKGKTYGDLAAAMRGVRKSPPSTHIQTPVSAQGYPVGFAPAYAGGAAGMRGGGKALGRSSSPPPPPPPAKSPQRKSGNYAGSNGVGPRGANTGGGRVVSRSGADIADQMHFPSAGREGVGYGQQQNLSGGNGWATRRRDVSGKVAEEGRGGDAGYGYGYGGGGWFR